MKKSTKQFSFTDRLASIGYAMNGLMRVMKFEHNARIHMVAAILAIVMGIIFRISTIEWTLIVLCIGLVFTAEIMNTAVEKLVDLVSPQKNEQAKVIKDLSAASVLFIALISLVAGLIIFLPYLFRL